MLAMWSYLGTTSPLPKVTLDAAGLLALADLSAIAERTALVGGASLLDIFVLCPGIHRQQAAVDLNKGEYPATAALTTGYVFRIENQATVFFLQRASQTAHLTTISVSPLPPQHWLLPDLLRSQVSITSQLLYHSAATLTLAAFAFLAAIADYWGVAILGILATARMLNFVVIRRRAARGMVWKGAAEPGVKGDLLILLSQDRWVRMQGLVDDLKAVTSGLWLADRSFAESSATAVSTVLVYAVAALATNVSQIGSIVLMVLLLGSAGALALANHHMTAFRMFGRELRVAGYRKRYERRRLLADDLISETGNREWALALGLIPASNGGENRAAVM